MPEQPATIKVINDNLPMGYMTINAEDFDPSLHSLYPPPDPVSHIVDAEEGKRRK